MEALFAVPLALLGRVSACSEDEGPLTLNVQDGSVSTPEDTPLTFRVPATSNGQVTASVASPPAHGTLTVTADAVTYTPAANYAGPDSVTISLTAGGESKTATVAITVTPV